MPGSPPPGSILNYQLIFVKCVKEFRQNKNWWQYGKNKI